MQFQNFQASIFTSQNFLKQNRRCAQETPPSYFDDLEKQITKARSDPLINELERKLDKLLEEQNIEKTAEYHYIRGQLYALQFKYSEALEESKKALQYQPDNEQYQNAVKEFEEKLKQKLPQQ